MAETFASKSATPYTDHVTCVVQRFADCFISIAFASTTILVSTTQFEVGVSLIKQIIIIF